MSRCIKKGALLRTLAGLGACVIGLGGAHAAIVTFEMKDVGIYPAAPPSSIVVTTGAQIPGGFDNSPAGNEFNISYLFFDIDGDLPSTSPADPTVYYDLRIRTASFAGGQIVFDGFQHDFTPGFESGSFVVMRGENSYLNFPFFQDEVIGDGVEEFVRDGFSPPGPPENNTFSVAIDEGGVVRYFTDEGVDYFVGFKLGSGNYGWFRAQYDSTLGAGVGGLHFLDGAYENTGAPIQAGQTESGVTENADFDGNGSKDGNDVLRWQRGLGIESGATLGDGDGNQDGVVNGVDLAIWKNQFGSAVPAIRAVPEPATLGLIGWCAVAALRRRRS